MCILEMYEGGSMKKTTAQAILAAIIGAIYGFVVWGLPFILIDTGCLYNIPVIVWIIWLHILSTVLGGIIFSLACLVKAALKKES